MIRIENISKSYRKNKALKDFSLTLENHTYGLLGPNGSGKTTLIRILTGIIKQSSGEVTFLNADKTSGDHRQIRIGYLPQKFGLLRELTVKEHMEYFACMKKISKREQSEEIERALEEVNLADKTKEKCGSLSGGMMRRVGVAQALMGGPDLLLFDEPTTGLDPEERLRFKSILQKISGKQPIILATHIVEDVEAVCDQFIIMNKGEKIFASDAKGLMAKASGRVYEVDADRLDEIKENYYLEKYLAGNNGKKMTRILITSKAIPNGADPLTEKQLNPTLEDGYMYLIKGV